MRKLLLGCVLLTTVLITSCSPAGNGELVGTGREPFFSGGSVWNVVHSTRFIPHGT